MFKQEGVEEVWLKLKKYVEQGMYKIKGQRKESVLKVETGKS